MARCVQVVEAASHSGKPEGRPVPIYNNVVSEQLLFERKTACRTAGKNIFGRRAKSAAMSVFLKNSLSERLRRALLALSCPFVAEPMLKIRFSLEKVKKYVKNLWGGGIFFIYLRREMFVEALIPGVLNGGFCRLFGHFSEPAKGCRSVDWGTQVSDMQHIEVDKAGCALLRPELQPRSDCQHSELSDSEHAGQGTGTE